MRFDAPRSKGLKNNYEIVMAAVSKWPWALRHASEELKSNHEIVMAAVSKKPEVLQCASKELKNDYEIVMAAVSKSRYALQHASEELKNNFKIVMAAVPKDFVNLPFAFEELIRGNNEIVVSHELREDLVNLRPRLREYPLVMLNVVLLSGRRASIIFSVDSSRHSVLLDCAQRFRLNPHQVTARGRLLSGSTTIVSSLHELQPWEVHDLTLVLYDTSSKGLS